MEVPQLENRSRKIGVLVNTSRVLDRFIRYWYITLITLLVGLAGAWAFNRYSTRIYPVTASMIIRENENASTLRSLYGTTLLNPERNYEDEFFIMRSYQLIQKVVEDLRLQVSYFREGEIKTVELYLPHFPVRFLPGKGSSLPFGKKIRFRVIDQSSYLLEPSSEDGTEYLAKTHYFDKDTVEFMDSRFVVAATGELSKWIGREYLIQFNDPYRLAVQYSGSLGLSWSQRGSGAVDLFLKTSVPERDRDFLQKFMEAYQVYDIEKKSSTSTKSMLFLDRQVAMIGDSLRFYESQLAKYAGKDLPGIGPEKISGISDQLDEKEIQLQLQDRYYMYLENYMNENSDLSQVLLPSALGVSDPVLSELVAKLSELQFKLRALQDQSRESANPLVAESHQKIALYKRDIAEGIRSAKEIMRINRNMLNERLKNLQYMISKKSSDDDHLIQLQRSYKFNENLFGFLVQKRSEAALSKAATVSDVSILNLPSIGSPLTPVPLRNYTIAVLIGLFLPLFGFILQEFLNNKVQSKEDIESISPVPVIATIARHTLNTNLVIIEKPRSLIAESFRALRSNLDYFVGRKQKKIILITSSLSGEGKSFTSINLATVMAMPGKPTVLIAGDMRKSSIADDFKVSNQSGLSLVLSGQAEVQSVIYPTGQDKLDFIPPGPPPPNPGELFLSDHLPKMIAQLQERYDNIIIDSPPVGLVSDALPLLAQVDHVVFVVRQNYTPINAIAQLQNLVDQGQLPNVSIILNDISRVGMGYGFKYGYGYDYGYGYRYGKSRLGGSDSKAYGYGDEAYS